MFLLQVKTRGSQRSAEPQEATQWGEVRAAAPGGEDVLCVVLQGAVNFSIALRLLSIGSCLSSSTKRMLLIERFIC